MAYFNPDESWVQRDNQTAPLLAHEQLHFDIAELYARKMRQKMFQYVGMNAEEFAKRKLSDEVKKIYRDYYNEMTDEQKRYDTEARHGLDTEAQANWEKLVSRDLESLRHFSR